MPGIRRHGLPWNSDAQAGSQPLSSENASIQTADELPRLKQPAWHLSKHHQELLQGVMVDMQREFKRLLAAAANHRQLSGLLLFNLLKDTWLKLDAEQEEAEQISLSLLSAYKIEHITQTTEKGSDAKNAGSNAIYHDHEIADVVMTWDELEECITEAYHEVTRHQDLGAGLQTGQQILKLAGTGVTHKQRTLAIQALRRSISADNDLAAIEGLEARLLLAKQFMAHASCQQDLDNAEALLHDVLLAGRRQQALLSSSTEHEDSGMEDDDEHDKQVQLSTVQHFMTSASTALGLLLAQAGDRDREAALVLAANGYRYRLARPVLHYALSENDSSSLNDSEDASQYVRALEGVLRPELLQALQAAFAPGSRFWCDHSYQPDGSTPYFSYVHPLSSPPGSSSCSLLDQVIQVLQQQAALLFPEAAQARWAEWWAHCRPHAHGHQLHFDSDNEGQGQVRNPIVSMVLYLTSSGIGGPTLVTTQRLQDKQLPRHGWLVHPHENRLCVFKGDVLHGVIPGRGVATQHKQVGSQANHPQFRVTFMVALWPDIHIREYPDGTHGAAQAYPYPSSSCIAIDAGNEANKKKRQKGNDKATKKWTSLFTPLAPPATEVQHAQEAAEVMPLYVSPIWVDVNQQTNQQTGGEVEQLADQQGLPAYDVCFQGF